jgi:hypothetical protein
MSRDDGFSIADIDTSILSDPKFRALWRHLNDPAAMGQAVAVYLSTLLESWHSGARSTAATAAPMWLPDVGPAVAALQAVGLLDDEWRIPEHAWQSWFTPVVARRNANRERWQRANANRSKPPDISPLLSPRGNTAVTAPSVPSVPTYPSVPSLPRGNDDVSLKDDDDRAHDQEYLATHGLCHRCRQPGNEDNPIGGQRGQYVHRFPDSCERVIDQVPA